MDRRIVACVCRGGRGLASISAPWFFSLVFLLFTHYYLL